MYGLHGPILAQEVASVGSERYWPHQYWELPFQGALSHLRTLAVEDGFDCKADSKSRVVSEMVALLI